MSNLEEIQQIASQIALRFDDPKSVKLQVKQIIFAQQQLRDIKKELNATIRLINEQTSQYRADAIFEGGLDVFEKRKLAKRVRTATRRALMQERKAAQQPYIELKEVVDDFISNGDRLKLMAQDYLLNYQQ